MENNLSEGDLEKLLARPTVNSLGANANESKRNRAESFGVSSVAMDEGGLFFEVP